MPITVEVFLFGNPRFDDFTVAGEDWILHGLLVRGIFHLIPVIRFRSFHAFTNAFTNGSQSSMQHSHPKANGLCRLCLWCLCSLGFCLCHRCTQGFVHFVQLRLGEIRHVFLTDGFGHCGAIPQLISFGGGQHQSCGQIIRIFHEFHDITSTLFFTPFPHWLEIGQQSHTLEKLHQPWKPWKADLGSSMSMWSMMDSTCRKVAVVTERSHRAVPQQHGAARISHGHIGCRHHSTSRHGAYGNHRNHRVFTPLKMCLRHCWHFECFNMLQCCVQLSINNLTRRVEGGKANSGSTWLKMKETVQICSNLFNFPSFCSSFTCFTTVSLCFTFSQAILWNSPSFGSFLRFDASSACRVSWDMGTARSLPTAYLQLSISTDLLANHGKSRDFAHFSWNRLETHWNCWTVGSWEWLCSLGPSSSAQPFACLLLLQHSSEIGSRNYWDRKWEPKKTMIYSSNNHQIIKSMGNISSIHFCFLIFLQGLHFSRSFLDTNFSLGAFRS